MTEERRIIKNIGRCGLTTTATSDDDAPVLGHWREATCAEWSEAVNRYGGLEKLTVWSSFTNMEWSTFGAPFIFTEWGTRDHPVAADGGHPSQRNTGTGPCRLTHAVFVPAEADEEGVEEQPDDDIDEPDDPGPSDWECDQAAESDAAFTRGDDR